MMPRANDKMQPMNNRASRFLMRYERCRKTIEEEERVLSLFEHNPSPLSHLRAPDAKSIAIINYLAPERQVVSDRLFYHYRLFEKLTKTLAEGIRRIPQKSLRDYLIWHYLYQFTHESIAEVMNYSVRQIYRQGAQARTALAKTLSLPPQARKIRPKRYKITAMRRTRPVYSNSLLAS